MQKLDGEIIVMDLQSKWNYCCFQQSNVQLNNVDDAEIYCKPNISYSNKSWEGMWSM